MHRFSAIVVFVILFLSSAQAAEPTYNSSSDNLLGTPFNLSVPFSMILVDVDTSSPGSYPPVDEDDAQGLLFYQATPEVIIKDGSALNAVRLELRDFYQDSSFSHSMDYTWFAKDTDGNVRFIANASVDPNDGSVEGVVFFDSEPIYLPDSPAVDDSWASIADGAKPAQRTVISLNGTAPTSGIEGCLVLKLEYEDEGSDVVEFEYIKENYGVVEVVIQGDVNSPVILGLGADNGTSWVAGKPAVRSSSRLRWTEYPEDSGELEINGFETRDSTPVAVLLDGSLAFVEAQERKRFGLKEQEEVSTVSPRWEVRFRKEDTDGDLYQLGRVRVKMPNPNGFNRVDLDGNEHLLGPETLALNDTWTDGDGIAWTVASATASSPLFNVANCFVLSATDSYEDDGEMFNDLLVEYVDQNGRLVESYVNGILDLSPVVHQRNMDPGFAFAADADNPFAPGAADGQELGDTRTYFTFSGEKSYLNRVSFRRGVSDLILYRDVEDENTETDNSVFVEVMRQDRMEVRSPLTGGGSGRFSYRFLAINADDELVRLNRFGDRGFDWVMDVDRLRIAEGSAPVFIPDAAFIDGEVEFEIDAAQTDNIYSVSSNKITETYTENAGEIDESEEVITAWYLPTAAGGGLLQVVEAIDGEIDGRAYLFGEPSGLTLYGRQLIFTISDFTEQGSTTYSFEHVRKNHDGPGVDVTDTFDLNTPLSEGTQTWTHKPGIIAEDQIIDPIPSGNL